MLELQDQLTAKGLQIPTETISQLMAFPLDALICLGGCTASFVSPKGLIVTNYHCAYGSIQHNSSAENHLIEKGFLANTIEGELLTVPGSRVYVAESFDEVTAQINADLATDLGPLERYQAIEAK